MDEKIIEHISSTPVLLMCGISGSGKTMLSQRLERQYGFVRISVDEMIWEKYGANFVELPFEERRRIFMSIDKDMEHRMENLLDRGNKVVVDATMCRRAKRDSMREMCRMKGIEPLIVYLQASLPLLRRRLSQRKGVGPNDQIVAPPHLEMYFSNFERPMPDEDAYVITQTI
ncbi:ATP-binding protein [uncultured Muribaculum sp.]|uniref:AAA family ATPase n=1 Tax=uncultured Muribaculum sp. TaxID=1918613 RepID=UPI0025F8F314|nr:ATP-binding protein [uncultured Muribaculum sp.]